MYAGTWAAHLHPQVSETLVCVVIMCTFEKWKSWRQRTWSSCVCVCFRFRIFNDVLLWFSPCSIYRGATPRRVNWPPSKSWTLPRYNGLLSFSIFSENDINQSQSYLLRFYGFNFLIFHFFFLGRGGGNQIGDQRPEKVFTPPQHRHLFRRLY